MSLVKDQVGAISMAGVVPVPGGVVSRSVFVDYARRLGWGEDVIAVALRMDKRRLDRGLQ